MISRLTEIMMAFPFLLFIIALAATVGDRLNKVTFGVPRARGRSRSSLVFGVFGWFYPARDRPRPGALAAREGVRRGRADDRRRATCGSSARTCCRTSSAPIIVYSTLIVARYILAEAGLSFLGLGIQPPTASWGNLLADAPNFYTTAPLLMLWPGLALLLTTLAFNLLGDGLRDAFDPRSRL